ncbi:hypothetical protein [Nonomuraea rubra]|uniref:hypothetical protein n=1 Tax=Nonomuraea rubra TaxID=46180 RepID=UPI0031E74832
MKAPAGSRYAAPARPHLHPGPGQAEPFGRRPPHDGLVTAPARAGGGPRVEVRLPRTTA